MGGAALKTRLEEYLLPFLAGREQTAFTSIVCVVPHKSLFEEMKQPHDNNKGQKHQTEPAKHKKHELVSLQGLLRLGGEI